jgi:hypothetical protein
MHLDQRKREATSRRRVTKPGLLGSPAQHMQYYLLVAPPPALSPAPLRPCDALSSAPLGTGDAPSRCAPAEPDAVLTLRPGRRSAGPPRGPTPQSLLGLSSSESLKSQSAAPAAGRAPAPAADPTGLAADGGHRRWGHRVHATGHGFS